jgi:hypothetical protein
LRWAWIGSRVSAESQDAREARAGQVHHHAGAAKLEHQVVTAAHLVDLARQVEGVHELATRAVGGPVHRCHHRPRPVLERAGRAVALQLVVLDEVEAGSGELGHQRRGTGGIEPDRRLDDGSDQRPAFDAGEKAGAVDAEARARIGGGELVRQADVEEPQAGELLEIEEVAGDGRDQVRQRRSHVVEGPGERDAAGAVRPIGPAGAGKRRPRNRPEVLERALSSGVSPGIGRKVPDDCSPAIASAASASGYAVSIR